MKRFFVILISLNIWSGCLLAQTVKYTVAPESTMSVIGTSTLHDWTSTVTKIDGFMELDKKTADKGTLKTGDEIVSVKIIVPAKSIISARGATMDKKTYDALKAEQFPDITFEFSKIRISQVLNDQIQVLARGNLTIAGKTNVVDIPVVGKVNSPTQMVFSGAHKLNMKNYDMEPPSAMFGQIVTGEEVEIKFELIFNK
jgi:polyisoprenoid-binding protein YceI